MTMLFIEKESRFSDYIKHEVSESVDMPKLTVLRVEMERVHPGMSDFIMRVSTPKYAGVERSGTVLSIRGNRNFTKFDTLQTLANTVKDKMQERRDGTYKWDAADADHIADLLFGPVKYFAGNTRVEALRFTTEAL